MKPSELLQRYRDEVRAIASRRGLHDIKVFGSVLHATDTENSDLDLLIAPIAGTSMFDIGGIQFEVSELLGIQVDVVTPAALPEAFRQRVLAEARPL